MEAKAMIIDNLKQFEQNNEWDIEHLSTIKQEELLDEVKNSYSNIVPMDYALYSNIPSIIVEQIVSGIEENESPLTKNSFYERLLLQLFYMEARGLDNIYVKGVISICAPGFAAFYLNKMLKDEEEYQYLIEEYDRYITRSLSLVGNQAKALESIEQISSEDLGNAIKKLKEIAGQEDK